MTPLILKVIEPTWSQITAAVNGITFKISGAM